MDLHNYECPNCRRKAQVFTKKAPVLCKCGKQMALKGGKK